MIVFASTNADFKINLFRNLISWQLLLLVSLNYSASKRSSLALFYSKLQHNTSDTIRISYFSKGLRHKLNDIELKEEINIIDIKNST